MIRNTSNAMLNTTRSKKFKRLVSRFVTYTFQAPLTWVAEHLMGPTDKQQHYNRNKKLIVLNTSSRQKKKKKNNIMSNGLQNLELLGYGFIIHMRLFYYNKYFVRMRYFKISLNSNTFRELKNYTLSNPFFFP